jgi:uncharacterized membrane protein
MSALKLFVHNHGRNGDQSLIKTVTFALTHFTVAFTVAYLLTGDLLIGSLIAMVEPAINTVAYFFHEKLWARSDTGPTIGAAFLWRRSDTEVAVEVFQRGSQPFLDDGMVKRHFQHFGDGQSSLGRPCE